MNKITTFNRIQTSVSLPPEFRSSKISNVSGISTIEQSADQKRSAEQRPRLEPPLQCHYMISLIELHQKVENVVSKQVTVFQIQSEKDLAEIESLEKAKREALQSSAEDAAMRNRWSVLGNVAQYLVTGTSFLVGLSLGPTSVGAVLFMSGVVGLSNRFVSDVVGWKSVAAWFTKSIEHQKQLVRQIETGLFYAELGTGLWGAAGACYRGAFAAASRLDAAKKFGKILQATGMWGTLVSRVGKSCADERMARLQARIEILDADEKKLQMELTMQRNGTCNLIETAQAMETALQNAITGSAIN